jgi:glycosyltransferase involved in cell wall biosynthesis
MPRAIGKERDSVQPPISIGMPVYNGELYLEAAIRSNLEQTFGDFELIISDNASTDATGTICRDLAATDKRIRYVRNDRNLGAASNYNKVFELARGEYFRWSNADDVAERHLLARTLEVLRSRPDAVIAYGLTHLIDADGRSLGPHRDNLDLQHERPSERYRAFYGQGNMTNIIYGLMRARAMRLTALMGAGSFPSADVQFTASMALLGKFVEIPEVLFYRRLHKGAMSVSVDQLQYRTFWAASDTLFLLPTWRYEIAGLKAIVCMPLSLSEKVRLLSFSAKRLLWRRKDLALDLIGLLRQGMADG